MLRFKKYSRRLAELYRKQSESENEWEQLTSRAGCILCPIYDRNCVGTYSGKLVGCCGCSKSDRVIRLGGELDRLEKEIDDFIENDYAQSVYEFYRVGKPDLIRKLTGETVSWEQAFGSGDFGTIEKSLRHSLVGLVEESGRYVLKK